MTRRRVAAMLVFLALQLGAIIGAGIGVAHDTAYVILIVGAGFSALVTLAGLLVLLIVHGTTDNPQSRIKASGVISWFVGVLGTGWMVIVSLVSVGLRVEGALWSLASTVLAVWAYRRSQRNIRAPWWTAAAAFGWGLIVASTLAGATEGGISLDNAARLLPGTGFSIAQAALAAFVEEIGKAAGILILFLLARRWFDSLVNGIVGGALIGLGFQFNESIGYLGGDHSQMLYQYWYRQVGGLFISHATYTAIVGAGIGVAATQPTIRRKIIPAAGALAIAIAGHLVWDTAAMGRLFWQSDNPRVELFLDEPLNLIVFKGPLFIALLALIVMGVRQESRDLVQGLRSEVGTGYGAIQPDETTLLANPRQRWRSRLRTWRQAGFAAYRRQKRLQHTQVELALLRCKRQNGQSIEPWQAESILRDRIRNLRPPAGTTLTPAVSAISH